MVGLRRAAALTALGLASAATLTSPGSGGRAPAGRWRVLPQAPIALLDRGPVSVWTGSRLVVFGRVTTGLVDRAYVAAAYDPGTGAWRRLPSLPKSVNGIYGYAAVWTGTEVLVSGADRLGRWLLR